jgi:hypothetical protein
MIGAVGQPWLDRRPSPRVHADLAPAIVLAVPDQNRTATLIKIGLGQRERLLDPQPGAPEHDDQRVEAMTVAIVPGLAHHRDDLIDRRRVRGVGLAIVARGYPGTRSWRGRWRTASTGSVKQRLRRQRGSLL